MRDASRWLPRLYLLNSALLCTHEIDSAYWKEWELFGLPGGIQSFLVANFVLVMIVLFGFRQVLLETRGARLFSLLLGAAGVFAFAVHTLFLLEGRPQFAVPVSICVLASTLLVSLVQIAFALLRPSAPEASPA